MFPYYLEHTFVSTGGHASRYMSRITSRLYRSDQHLVASNDLYVPLRAEIVSQATRQIVRVRSAGPQFIAREHHFFGMPRQLLLRSSCPWAHFRIASRNSNTDINGIPKSRALRALPDIDDGSAVTSKSHLDLVTASTACIPLLAASFSRSERSN